MLRFSLILVAIIFLTLIDKGLFFVSKYEIAPQKTIKTGVIPCKCQSYFFQFTLGLSLNCLQCGNGGNFPNGQGCQGYEEGTSVLCPADSDTCMKSTCGLQSSTNIVIFKGCADSTDSANLPCHIEVNISICIYLL